MKFFNVLSVFLLCLCISQTSYADKFTGSTSRWPVNQTKALALSDTHAFVGDGDTINIYDKETLNRVSYLRFDNLDENGYHNASEGFLALIYDDSHEKKYLYAACGYSGILIIEVTSPTNPMLRAKINISNNPTADSQIIAYDIAQHGNYLFVADMDYCLRIYNISNPESPYEKCYLDLSKANREVPLVPMHIGVYSTGIMENVWAILVASSTSGPLLCRFRIDDLGGANPVIKSISASNLPSLAVLTSFIVDGDYAYCMDGYLTDLYIYNVSHDNFDSETGVDLSPELVFAQSKDDDYEDNYLMIFNPRGMFKLDDRLYFTTHGYINQDDDYKDLYGINSIDLTDLQKPEPIDRVLFSGLNSVVVENDENIADEDDNDIYYMTSSWDGVIRSSISGYVTAETMINAYDISIEKETGIIWVCDGKATTPDETHGVTILRVKPETVTETDEDTGEETTTIVRQAGPALPVKENFITIQGTAKASCFDPTLRSAYIAGGTSGIHVLDLATADSTVGPGNPVIVDESNIPAPVEGATTYEVIDISVEELITDTTNNKYLMALTTNPDGEVMIVDVTTETSEDNPVEYSPLLTVDLDGATTPRHIMAYEYNDNLYAFVAQGTEGLSLIHLNPDWENPNDIKMESEEDQIIHLDFENAMSAYAYNNEYETNIVNNTGIFAYVANGAGGVVILQLYEETDLATMKPFVLNTIDTSAYGNAVDVHIFQNTVSRTLYVLTDNPFRAVLLYDITDFENPELKGFSATFGQSSALWATQLNISSESSISGYVTIRGVFIADGAGGVAFRQVTDETAYADRDWDENKTKFCFISSASGMNKSGLIPVFGLTLFGLGLLAVFALRIRLAKNPME